MTRSLWQFRFTSVVDEGTGRLAGAFLLTIGEMRGEVNRLRKKRRK